MHHQRYGTENLPREHKSNEKLPTERSQWRGEREQNMERNVSVIFIIALKFSFQVELIRDLINANRLYNSYHFGRRPNNPTKNVTPHTQNTAQHTYTENERESTDNDCCRRWNLFGFSCTKKQQKKLFRLSILLSTPLRPFIPSSLNECARVCLRRQCAHFATVSCTFMNKIGISGGRRTRLNECTSAKW